MPEEQHRNPVVGVFLVILATAGWGTSGVFISFIAAEIEISAFALAFWRDLTTFVCLAVGLGLFKPSYLKVNKPDLPWLAGLGIFSIGIFHILWNLSVWINGVAVATVLQEIAPAFVAIVAWLVLREPLTRRKVLAVLITFVGCLFVVRLDLSGATKVSSSGILIGLGSAITYGTFSLFGKKITGKYTPWTILTYGFGFALLVLFPLQFISPGPFPLLTPARWWFACLIALPTIAAFGIYTFSLRWLPASVAAIVATSEVVFGSFFAYLFLTERLDWIQVIGAGLVIAGVVVLSLSNQRVAKGPRIVASSKGEEIDLAKGAGPPTL